MRLPGLPHHVVQRGLDRQAVFFEDEDRRYFLATLAESAVAYRVAVHAYCLMSNHVHLLLTPHGTDSLARTMQRLGREYVHYVNRRAGRSGTLWDGRYRACVVDTDGYLLACHRYIELNPVRAGLVPRPEDWPWSSHRATALGHRDPLVTPHPGYLARGRDHAERARNHRALFDEDLTGETLEEVRAAVNHNHVLGGTRFKGQVAAMLGRRVGSGRRGRPRKSREADEDIGD